MASSVIIRTKFEFDAAHVQPADPGKCSRLHGHRYVAYLDIEGPINSETGYVIEYGELKRLLKRVLIPDHLTLNTAKSLARAGIEVDPKHIWKHALDLPSIENLAERFGELCSAGGPVRTAIYPAQVVRVTIWETPNFSAIWTR